MAYPKRHAASLAHSVDHRAEKRELLAGILLILLALLIGDRKVRVHALGLKPWQAAGVYHVLHALVKILACAEKAKA